MFGQMQVSSDYTFTQSENLNTTNTTKSSSSHSGDRAVLKLAQSKNSEAAYKTNKKNTSTIDNTDNNSDNQVEGISTQDQSDKEDQENIEIIYGNGVPTTVGELAAIVGGRGDKVTKEQLMSYLKSVSSGESANVNTITIVKNLIAQFDALSDGSGYIKSFSGIKEPQDHETITKEQVTSPIDIRV